MDMRKTAQCIFMFIVCMLFVSSGCEVPRSDQKAGEESRVLPGQETQGCDVQANTEGRGGAAANSPERDGATGTPPPLTETDGILGETEVLDLGDHMAAYYQPVEEIDSAYTHHGYETFQGNRYLVIQDLDSGAVWYVPDVYGKILEITVQAPLGVSLRYVPDGEREECQVCIPIYFHERDEEKVLDFDRFVHKEKSVFSAQEGMEADTGALPRTVWEESFCRGQEEYTLRFERISPIYNPGYESGIIEADYLLSVWDGEGNALSRQMIVHYPVAYEEAYWLIDFSGDGFLDVAFCTDVYMGGKNGCWSFARMLIWNGDTGCYEECEIGKKGNMAVWNADMAALVSCDDTVYNHYSSKNMYVWIDGQWQRIRRLERVYSETEFYDIPGEGEVACSDGYRELIYSDGEVTQENRIEEDFYEEDMFWHEEECVWSDNYRGSIRLYPDWPEWEKVETDTGGITVNKYISPLR